MPINQDRLKHHKKGYSQKGAEGSRIRGDYRSQAETIIGDERKHKRNTQQLTVPATESTRRLHKGKHRQQRRHDGLGIKLEGSGIGKALAYRAAGIEVEPVLARGNEEKQGEKRKDDFLSGCL